MKLTQEQLAAIIAKIFANLVAAGKDPASITTEDITTELNAVLEAEGASAAGEGEGAPAGEGTAAGEGEGKGEGEGGEPAVTPEFIAMVMEALKDCTKSGGEPSAQKGADPAPQTAQKADSAAGGSEGKAAAPAAQPQRKYASIFLATPPARGPAQHGSDFKTRIASMSERERRKTTFGMFGRAVKCIHASHGDPEQAAFTAERKFQDAEMAHEFKALSATVPSDGGYLRQRGH